MLFCFGLLLNLIFVLVDAAAVDNNTRISPENNLDFYPYPQTTSYSVNSCFVCIVKILNVYEYTDATID
jgi:hypothetical protein